MKKRLWKDALILSVAAVVVFGGIMLGMELYKKITTPIISEQVVAQEKKSEKVILMIPAFELPKGVDDAKELTKEKVLEGIIDRVEKLVSSKSPRIKIGLKDNVAVCTQVDDGCSYIMRIIHCWYDGGRFVVELSAGQDNVLSINIWSDSIFRDRIEKLYNQIKEMERQRLIEEIDKAFR